MDILGSVSTSQSTHVPGGGFKPVSGSVTADITNLPPPAIQTQTVQVPSTLEPVSTTPAQTNSTRQRTPIRGEGATITTDPLSYAEIVADMLRFRQAGGRYSSEFNYWDAPGHNFFRILFHFFDSSEDGHDNGLLGPTWMRIDPSATPEINGSEYWEHNTAWAYLMQNAEYVRANILKKFIELLSNINSNSPWYFQSVKGVNDALNRRQVNETFEFKERKKITIECLNDAQDGRIATLLDLYRQAVWSWRTKRQVIPSNLLKFDMTVVIISSPVQRLYVPRTKYKAGPKEEQSNDGNQIIGQSSQINSNTVSKNYASATPSANIPTSSYKMIEFHNCEIDYNSSASGYEDVNNIEGFSQKFNIDITYDDAIEVRYNDFMNDLREITDLIGMDSLDIHYGPATDATKSSLYYKRSGRFISKSNKNDPKTIQSMDGMGDSTEILSAAETAYGANDVPKPIDEEKEGVGLWDKVKDKAKTAATNAAKQLAMYGASYVDRKITSFLLGNLFGFSLSKMARQAGQLANGNVIGTIQNISGYTKKTDDRGKQKPKINPDPDSFQGSGTIVSPYRNISTPNIPKPSDVISLGNLFKSQTITSSTL